ncbi:MAG: hypothetical protein ACRD0Z_02920 [Acidimicrobiales bacterium]
MTPTTATAGASPDPPIEPDTSSQVDPDSFQITLVGPAAQLVRELINRTAPIDSASVGAVVADALVVKKWVDANVKEQKLFLRDMTGRMTEVTRAQ